MDSPSNILEVVAFLDLFAAGMIGLQLPPRAASLGCSIILVYFMVTSFFALQLVTRHMTTALSEIKGRRQLLLLTLLLSGAAFVLLGLTTSITLFLGLRAFLGVVNHTQLLVKSIIPDYVPDSKMKSSINERLSMFANVGMVLGPITGSLIMEMFPSVGFTVIAFIVGVIFAVNYALTSKLPDIKSKEDKENKTEELSLQEIAPKLVTPVKNYFQESFKQIRKVNWNTYGNTLLFRILLFLTTAIYLSNFALYLRFKYSATPVIIAYVDALLTACRVISTYYIGFINDQYKDDSNFTERNKHVFVILLASLVGLSISTSVPVYIAFVIPLGVCLAIGEQVTLDMVLKGTNDEQKAIVFSVSDSMRVFFSIVVTMLVGIFSEFCGVLYVIYIAIIVAGFGVYRSYNSKAVAKKHAKTK